MESRHIVINANVSIRKIRTFLPKLKKMSPVDAVSALKQLPHSAARSLVSAIQTAMANAESTLKVSKGMLEFRRLYADQGMVLKRSRPGSRGTAKPIMRRMTHITVILGVKPGQVQPEKKEEVKVVEPVKKGTTAPKEAKKETAKKKTKIQKTKIQKTTSKVTKKSN